ncbi:MAG TPA: BTAD domain-containing putative transcriptional regulator [Acidimicrobiales bacterium]
MEALNGAHRPGPPVADRDMLVRERLVERLRSRWFVPVTVVSAPAGYGKTTLLAQAMAANAAAPLGLDCWLACGPGLTAASALGEALCRAVEAAPAPAHALEVGGDPAGPAGAPAGLTGPAGPVGPGLAVGAPPGTACVAAGPAGAAATGPAPGGRPLPDGGPATVAAAVADAVWRRSPQPVCLIIDDVHEIPAGSEAAGLLDAVVRSLPANGHVVFVGRGEPPVRLARLDVAGQLVRLGQADLAFTEAEIAEFAALRGAPGDRVAACGGWPALAELFASARPGAAGDYVGEEVLGPLSPATRRALALLAHLGPVDDELARAAVGEDVGEDVAVAELLAGLPLVTREAGGEWRLHALWRSLLADDVTPAEVAGARRRAGRVLRGRGQAAAAVRSFLEAEAWDEFGDAIAEALGVAHPPVARDQLAEWFAQLPPEIRAEPGGRLLAGVLAVESDPEGARHLLEECAAAFRDRGDTAGEIACLVQLGQMAWWSEQPEALAGVAARGFELEAAGCEEIVPLACLGRGLLFDIDNDSRSMLAELDRILPGSLNDAWWGIVCWTRAIGLLELGLTGAAVEAADAALAHADRLYAPLAQTTRLQALWFQGRTGEVRRALPGVLRSLKRSGYRHHTALVAAQCAASHALLGRAGDAAGYLEDARAAALGARQAPLVDTNLAIAEAAVALAEGDEERAAAALAADVADHPVRRGVTAAPQQRQLALYYVLVPATRPAWDAAELGPAWAFARDLARAVVAVREGGALPEAIPALADPNLVQAHLPPAWVAALGLAATAAGREDGWQLLDGTWAVTRPTVVDLAGGTDVPARVARAAREALGRLAAPPTERLDLRLLGPVELRAGGELVQAAHWRRRRVRSLLAYLVLNRTVSRGQLADDLWPDLDPDAQSRNLRVTLSYLLQVLEPERGQRDASFFVRQHGDNVTLHPGEWLRVDLWDFDAHSAAAADAERAGAPATALEHGLRAVELWRDEPVELVSEPWALAALEQRRLRFAALAVRSGELLLARGDSERALALANRVLAIDPWREGAHRLVVATHVARRDQLAARRALRRYRDAVRELGIDPGEATLMVERLLESLPTG